MNNKEKETMKQICQEMYGKNWYSAYEQSLETYAIAENNENIGRTITHKIIELSQ